MRARCVVVGIGVVRSDVCNPIGRDDLNNPYAQALVGLELDNPVESFFDFCREREAIRQRRSDGQPAPWSDDPVFQKGRFLNVFREDDRTSQALMRFVEPVANDLPRLVQAVFFARWCNRSETLEALDVALLLDPEALRRALENLPNQPWCNVTAYPVEPIHFDGRLISRLDAATYLFDHIKEQLVAVLCASAGQVTVATQAVNDVLGMHNDFPIFMAVMDLAWFRPDMIDPASPVPTGIGAEPFMDILADYLGASSHHDVAEQMIALQARYWPDAKRSLQPIDVEYLTCECRKYLSYINGTKTFVGKNVFYPGQTPALLCDLPNHFADADPVDTQLHVLAGGPCSGKTTLLLALAKAGYTTRQETAKIWLDEAAPHERESMRIDPISWQRRVFRADVEMTMQVPPDDLVFCDTSCVENLIFGERAGLAFGPNTQAWLRRYRYRRVFFCEPLATYEQTLIRKESQEVALSISAQIAERYQELGYDVVRVPALSVEDRVAWIERAILSERN